MENEQIYKTEWKLRRKNIQVFVSKLAVLGLVERLTCARVVVRVDSHAGVVDITVPSAAVGLALCEHGLTSLTAEVAAAVVGMGEHEGRGVRVGGRGLWALVDHILGLATSCSTCQQQSSQQQQQGQRHHVMI